MQYETIALIFLVDHCCCIPSCRLCKIHRKIHKKKIQQRQQKKKKKKKKKKKPAPPSRGGGFLGAAARALGFNRGARRNTPARGADPPDPPPHRGTLPTDPSQGSQIERAGADQAPSPLVPRRARPITSRARYESDVSMDSDSPAPRRSIMRTGALVAPAHGHGSAGSIGASSSNNMINNKNSSGNINGSSVGDTNIAGNGNGGPKGGGGGNLKSSSGRVSLDELATVLAQSTIADVFLTLAALHLRRGALLKGGYYLRRAWKAYVRAWRRAEDIGAAPQTGPAATAAAAALAARLRTAGPAARHRALVRAELASSLRFGRGFFLFFISLCPPKFAWVVSAIGFSFDPTHGRQLLIDCASSPGSRARPAYHLILWMEFAFYENMRRAAHVLLSATRTCMPASPTFLFLSGYMHRDAGDLASAVASFTLARELAREIAPLRTQCLYELGYCQFILRHWAVARDLLERFLLAATGSVENDPQDSSGAGAAGNGNGGAGFGSRKASTLSVASSIPPSFPSSSSLAGMVPGEESQSAGRSSLAHAAYLLGMCHHFLGHNARAGTALRRAEGWTRPEYRYVSTRGAVAGNVYCICAENEKTEYPF
jgi:hypothetical protein